MSEPVEVPESTRRQLYHPLAPWQIRLLRIHPSEDLESNPVCDLLVADLISFPGVGLVQESTIVQYEALSYSWGYPGLSKTVECNGTNLAVSETAHEAIRHIRLPDGVTYLWTDVCCINQADLGEKSVQVGMMFTIFQKASLVIAWLGTPSPDEKVLFTIIDSTESGCSFETAMRNEQAASGVHQDQFPRSSVLQHYH